MGQIMKEKDIIKSIIDFSFIIKSQLQSEQTAMLRSILAITIMECEDLLSDAEESNDAATPRSAGQRPA